KSKLASAQRKFGTCPRDQKVGRAPLTRSALACVSMRAWSKWTSRPTTVRTRLRSGSGSVAARLARRRSAQKGEGRLLRKRPRAVGASGDHVRQPPTDTNRGAQACVARGMLGLPCEVSSLRWKLTSESPASEPDPQQGRGTSEVHRLSAMDRVKFHLK